MIPNASRRIDWHLIIRALDSMSMDTIRTKLQWWGVAESIAMQAVPHSFIWLPAPFGQIIPGAVMQSGKRWLVLVPEGYEGGPYMFTVRFRGSQPPNEVIRMWVDETPAHSHTPPQSQSA